METITPKIFSYTYLAKPETQLAELKQALSIYRDNLKRLNRREKVFEPEFKVKDFYGSHEFGLCLEFLMRDYKDNARLISCSFMLKIDHASGEMLLPNSFFYGYNKAEILNCITMAFHTLTTRKPFKAIAKERPGYLKFLEWLNYRRRNTKNKS